MTYCVEREATYTIILALDCCYRRRRVSSVRRYARYCYVLSQSFDDPVNTANDLAFLNHFQEFVFDVNESQDGLGSQVLSTQRRRWSLLSAHEDALRASVTPTTTSTRSSSQSTSGDQGRRSYNNNDEVRQC